MAHLIWDWNGTLLDDLDLVVAATNISLATLDGPRVTADEHRRDFHRPVSSYYAHVLGRPVSADEFAILDAAFHRAYRAGLAECSLTADALEAVAAWPGTQSLLSMFFHRELVPVVTGHGLHVHLSRIDGLRDEIGGGSKLPHLTAHIEALGLAPEECVLIGDSVDDAEAAQAIGAGIVLYGGGFTDASRLRETGVPVASTLVEAVALATRSIVTTSRKSWP
jgi:phosphoglycolate phosphatase-like HAD superfamily hydrolase